MEVKQEETMDNNELKKERIALFKDTIQRNDPKRIAHFGNLFSWKVLDAGYTLTEALYDYDVMENVIRDTASKYKVDVIYEFGWRNPLQAIESLGNKTYLIDDKTFTLNIDDQCLMEEEEYDELISNPKKYLWEKLIPRKHRYLKDKNGTEAFRVFLKKYGEMGEYLGKATRIMEEDYGLASFFPQVVAFDAFGNGLELLFNSLRGIRGLSLDIRRFPDKVEAAIEALNETFVKPRLEKAKKVMGKGSSPDTCVDFNPVFFSHTIFNNKQFERFYWPYMKIIADYLEEYDKLCYIFAEGDSSRFYEFYQEFPKNRIVLHVEQDDIFEAKKKLPNLTIAGGMPTTLLGKGTPDQCVAYVKKLIDKLAYDKNYIFSEDKMISFPYDCQPENLKAVCDYLYAFRY